MAFSRIRQKVYSSLKRSIFIQFRIKFNESVGSASRTEYDAEFEKNLSMALCTKQQVELLRDRIEHVLQPDPSIRLTSLAPEGASKLESFAQALDGTAKKFGDQTKLGASFKVVSAAEDKMGVEERLFQKKVDVHVIQALQRFIDEDYKRLADEKKILTTKRLDMDGCKNKVRTSKKKEQVVILEEKLKEATKAFDDQAEVVRELLEKYPEHHENIRQKLRDFLKAQVHFHKSSLDALHEAFSKFD